MHAILVSSESFPLTIVAEANWLTTGGVTESRPITTSLCRRHLGADVLAAVVETLSRVAGPNVYRLGNPAARPSLADLRPRSEVGVVAVVLPCCWMRDENEITGPCKLA